MAKILIVDDDAANRHLLAVVLGRAGHDVLEAAGGDEAIDIARSARPHLVIVDLHMPGMSGAQLVKHLRAFPEFKDVKIALYTGTRIDAMLEDFMAMHGVQHVIPKPCEPHECIRIVSDALTKA